MAMLINMTQNGKRAAVEGNREDRISGLPRNVIDNILELLPVQDAARTSILSRSWRYVWATFPNLVLDYHLCCNLIEESESNFKEAVDGILALHMGDIMKFVLNVSGARLSSYAAIDRWVHYVTRNGVETLTLHISNKDTYSLPSSIFNCSTLRHLKLSKCFLKPPISFLGFQNLINLDLDMITFVPTTSYCVIKAPHLTKLTLKSCHGTQYLNILSPGLECFHVSDSHLLNSFMNCKNLSVSGFLISEVVNYSTHNHKSTLEKLLVSLPALEVLRLDYFNFALLSKDIVPNGLPFMLNCLWHLILNVDFGDLADVSCALKMIKNLPSLSKLEIWAFVCCNEAESVLKYLDAPSCSERPLDKLECVAINDFESSQALLPFAKLLLSLTPSLLRMRIDQYTDIDTDIALELMHFPRASPRAELFYSQKNDEDDNTVGMWFDGRKAD